MKLNKNDAREIFFDVLNVLSGEDILEYSYEMEQAIKDLSDQFFEAFAQRWSKPDIEDLLKEKMAEGWNISVECKGKGRTYEMSYEGSATPVGKIFGFPDFELRHAVGDTLSEFLDNLFNNPVVHQKTVEKGVQWEQLSLLDEEIKSKEREIEE